MTQSIILFALGKVDAGLRALETAIDLKDAEGDRAKLLKSRLLIAQGRDAEAAELLLPVSEAHLDLPLAVYTCDWLISKDRLQEALDRLRKLHLEGVQKVRLDRMRLFHGSEHTEEGPLAVDARIGACFWNLGQKALATPYFKEARDLYASDDAEAQLANTLPPGLRKAWQEGNTGSEKQQNTEKGTTVVSAASDQPQSSSLTQPFPRTQNPADDTRREVGVAADDAAATPDKVPEDGSELRPKARGRHDHRPRPQPPFTFWQRLFGLFGHKETKPDKPRP